MSVAMEWPDLSFSSFHLAMTEEDESALWALVRDRFGPFWCFDFHNLSAGGFTSLEQAPGQSVTMAFGAPREWRPKATSDGVWDIARPTVSYGWPSRNDGRSRLASRSRRLKQGYRVELIEWTEFSFCAERDDREAWRKIAAFRRLLPKMATNDYAWVSVDLAEPPSFKLRQRSDWIGRDAAVWVRGAPDRFIHTGPFDFTRVLLPIDDPRAAPWENGKPTASLRGLALATPRTVSARVLNPGYSPEVSSYTKGAANKNVPPSPPGGRRARKR